MLVPSSCRLAKKLGDLLQLLFFMHDWQPSTPSSRPYPATSGAIAAVPSSELPPRSHIEVCDTDDDSWVLTGLDSVPGRMLTCGAVTAQSFASHMQAVLEAFAQGLVFEGRSEAGIGFEGVLLNDEGQHTLRQMRLCIAALHVYFEALATKPGTLEVGNFLHVNCLLPNFLPMGPCTCPQWGQLPSGYHPLGLPCPTMYT